MGAEKSTFSAQTGETFNNNCSKMVGFEITLTEREKSLIQETWKSIKKEASKVGIITFVR